MTLVAQIDAPWKTDPAIGSVPDSFKLFQKRFLVPLGKTVSNMEREHELKLSAEQKALKSFARSVIKKVQDLPMS